LTLIGYENAARNELPKSILPVTILTMSKQQLMTEEDIQAFGVEIVCRQLEQDGWMIASADGLADKTTQPQIIAQKSDEYAFFVVRTDLYPNRGRFDEGQHAFETLVRHAGQHGASCYFASVGIANSDGKTEEEMSVPVKGVAYHVEFNGLVKMELPPADSVTAMGKS
jgi:hypothetical protein